MCQTTVSSTASESHRGGPGNDTSTDTEIGKSQYPNSKEEWFPIWTNIISKQFDPRGLGIQTGVKKLSLTENWYSVWQVWIRRAQKPMQNLHISIVQH